MPSVTATLNKNRERDYFVTEPKIQLSDVKKSHFAPENSGGWLFFNQLKIQPIDTQPLITIQNGNCKESSQLEKINQLSFFVNNLSRNEHLKRKLAIFGTVRAIKKHKSEFFTGC